MFFLKKISVLWMLPYSCIIPALAIFYIIENIKTIFAKVFGFLQLILFSLFLYNFILLTPYHYTYLNILNGKSENHYKKFENDYWGSSMKELILNTNINKKSRVIFSSCGIAEDVAKYYLKKAGFSNFSFESLEKSDFIIMTNRSTNKIENIYSSDNITNCFDGTVVIMDDGSLYGVGYNQYYQLGIGTQTSIYTLTSISLPTNRTAVSVHGGYMYLIVLMDDGSLYGCGLNNNGQLGLGDTNNKNVLTQIPLPSGKTISSIKCAMQYFAILMTDGTIYGTGRSPILGNYNKDVKTSLTQVQPTSRLYYVTKS